MLVENLLIMMKGHTKCHKGHDLHIVSVVAEKNILKWILKCPECGAEMEGQAEFEF